MIEALERQGARARRPDPQHRVRLAGHDRLPGQPRGLGHAVGCAREAVGDQPFAVMLPDELMGDSSLLAQMNGVCVSSGGSVVGLKRVPEGGGRRLRRHRAAVAVDPDGVVAIGGLVEKPAPPTRRAI